MAKNRVWRVERRGGATGEPEVDGARRAAFVAIDEILSGEAVEAPGRASPSTEVERPGRQLPRRVPVPGPARQPLGPVTRRFRFKRRFLIVALTLGLAIALGLLIGSGLMSRTPTNGYTAQPGEAGAYGIPEVPGHPGGVQD